MSNDRDRTGEDEGEFSADFASWYRSASPDEVRRAHALEQLQHSINSPAAEVAPHPPSRERSMRGARIYLFTAAAVAAGAFFAVVSTQRAGAPRGDSALAAQHTPAHGAPEESDRQPVGFALQLTDGTARHVSLAGDFNGWNAAALPMLRDAATGVWRIRITLPPGRHAYSYVIDGTRWVIDPLAPRTDEGELGPTNVITIAGDS